MLRLFKSKRNWVLALVTAFLLLIPAESSAMPLEEYQKAVNAARTELAVYSAENLYLSNENTAIAASEAFARSVETLSKIEEVEYKNQSVSVDNEWLRHARTSFESEKDTQKKKQILTAAADRLGSIAVKIKTLTGAEGRKGSKDEEKRRLAKILEREEFGAAEIKEESPAAKLYRLITEWLRSIFPQMEPVAPQQSADLSILRNVLQVVILLLVIAIIIYVVIRFGPLILKRAGSREKKGKKQLILGEEIGPDVTTEDLFAEAERLAVAGDIRGAIRKGYISLLFELSQRKLIGLAKHKTNRDYLRDLPRNEKLLTDVTGLTSNYERHWYGRKEAQGEEWEDFKQGYQKALKPG